MSVAKARLLACETNVLPAVFDYAAGEAVELGRTARLPNTALRRKLELEQPGGCAWHGCDRPVAWTEAHHIVHWADGGPTDADNLILLCRFHHGRIHTTGWTIDKTGPGQALITHHDHPADAAVTLGGATGCGQAGQGQGGQAATGTETATGNGCGCVDWRTDADLDTEHHGSDWDVFATGLYRTEWAASIKADLDTRAEAVQTERARTAIRQARTKARERFGTSQRPPRPAPPAGTAPPGTRPTPNHHHHDTRTPQPAHHPPPTDPGEPPF
ncbi:HNH endonuclease signature motif containing protein [Glycomyces albidus]|uniref:HNH endonuclease signature motif containing protein n=1 Tax=Glycomyces albidus TaxID=2656774 RepID=UPI002AD499E4|nr:HNH endonuclease signature motif containing protein [Glycomyces albidus]